MLCSIQDWMLVRNQKPPLNLHTMFDQLGFLVQDQEWREEEEWGVTETLPETGKIPGDSFFSASNI